MEHEPLESEYFRAEYNRVNKLAMDRLKEANQLFHWAAKIQDRYALALADERRQKAQEFEQSQALMTALS